LTSSSIAISEKDLGEYSDEELRELYRKLDSHGEALNYAKGDIYLENAHEDQISFHEAKNRVRLFFGGNRSGKSTAGTNEARWLAEGTHPFNKEFRTPSKGCIVVQDFQTHARDIILPKIAEWFPPGLIVDREKNQAKVDVKMRLKNGSTIDMKSHDQDLKVFEGSDYDWVWFDEPPPELIFKAIWRGLTDRRGICFITGTPIVEPWMYDLYKKAAAEQNKGLYWYVFADIHKNAKNLGEGSVEEGQRRIDEFLDALDPEEREAREKGRFLHMSGLIFKDWDRGIHLVNEFPWPHSWPILISVDPHPRKPWAISFLGITASGNVILLTSAKIDGVVEDIAEYIFDARERILLDREGVRPKITACWIDNYANVDSMIKKTAAGRPVTILEELNSYVTPTIPRFQPAPKNVEDKIAIMKEWLKPKDSKYGVRPRFMAFDSPDNKDFVFEMEHFVWAKQKGTRKNLYKNQPVKENDDILDTVMQVCLVLGSNTMQTGLHAQPKVHSYTRR
jgi:phage terminase large subunit-like protein